MAGIDVRDFDAPGQVEGLVIGMGADQFQGGFGVLEGIEGDDGGLSAPVGLLVQIGGVGLLDVGGIAQHDRQKVGGGGGGMDGVAVALLGQGGDVAAVVDMGVGQDHGIHGDGIESEGAVDFVGVLAAALEESAIEQDPRAIDFQEVFGAGHRVGAAEEMPLHAGPFAGCS